MAEEERRVWLEEAMNRWETSLLRLCVETGVIESTIYDSGLNGNG